MCTNTIRGGCDPTRQPGQCQTDARYQDLLVIATAAAQSCPANQINSDAQIVTYGEGIIPADLITAVPSVVRNPALIDPNLTFSVKY